MLVVLEVSERRASAWLKIMSAKQVPLVPFLTSLVWHDQVSNTRPPAAPEAGALPLELSGLVEMY